MSKLRFEVVTAAFAKNAVEIPDCGERPSEYYAVKVFNREKMFKYLPKELAVHLEADFGTHRDSEHHHVQDALGVRPRALEHNEHVALRGAGNVDNHAGGPRVYPELIRDCKNLLYHRFLRKYPRSRPDRHAGSRGTGCLPNGPS